jgi:hypothetical protein
LLCLDLKKYHFRLYNAPKKLVCFASSQSCAGQSSPQQPIYSWGVNDKVVDAKTFAVDPQMKVCANDQTDPFKLNCSIFRSFIDCTLTQDASVLELRFPDSLIGHFVLTISLHAIDVVRPEVTTVTVNTEELVMDPSWNKDGKHCAKEFIHQLDHRIEADPRLELIKNFAEPPPLTMTMCLQSSVKLWLLYGKYL